MSKMRTHQLGELNESFAEQKVSLCGWIHRKRDHGGVEFLDLRDRSGFCQVVVPEDIARNHKLRSEFVIQISGTVKERPAGMKNEKLSSGGIEVHVEKLIVLSTAEVPPFSLEEENMHVNETTRLKYRYLDLRRPALQEKIRMRHEVMQATRKYFSEQGFWEIDTPILYKTTPEGARDFLVPSRLHPGTFFALPQSPQTLKQLLMISGMDRYFQIAKCFRDEDLRADRQLEFTQIDLEMSFFETEELFEIMENFIKSLFKQVLKIDIQTPFRQMSYDEALAKYGSDKPDLRYELQLKNLSGSLKNSGFQVFDECINTGGQVIGLPIRESEVKNHGCDIPQWSRKFFDGLGEVVKPFGLKGVAWVKIEDGGEWKSSIAKFFSRELMNKIGADLKLKQGDYLLFAAERAPNVVDAMGALRQYMARELGLVKAGLSDQWEFLWIIDWPLFEYDAKNKRLGAAHHPFTRCRPEDVEKLKSGNREEQLKAKAEAYDLVLNGHEVAGGSLRIFSSEEQAAMFSALGFSPEEAKRQFGFFIDALQFGTPPHGGIAFGFDRLLMLMTGTEAIRDVIAFPKTTNAQCQMSDSPSTAGPEQLAELRIQMLK